MNSSRARTRLIVWFGKKFFPYPVTFRRGAGNGTFCTESILKKSRESIGSSAAMPDGMRIQETPRTSLEESDRQHLDTAILMLRLNPLLMARLFFAGASTGKYFSNQQLKPNYLKGDTQ